MNVANVVAMLGVAFGLVALAIQIVVVRGREDLAHWARYASLAAAGAMVASFIWLLGRFVVADVGVEYVHLYTHESLPLRWRISGTWTGRQGSLLLWAAWLSSIVALFGWKRRNQHATWMALLVIQVPLLAAVAMQNTFAATPDWLLQSRPLGSGLNPTLKSLFILIHPPLMFLAYSLVSVPAAAGLAHLATGSGAWARESRIWSRWAWIVYTVAMGLGAMWAYATLNFGGYWAWDPVEVANLLPWLALTTYLHAEARSDATGGFATLGPMLAQLPLVLTLFSTLSTRSGLWVSIHAFTDPTNTFQADPALRLLDILAVDPSLLPYVGMMLALPAVALALWARRVAADEGRGLRLAQVLAALLGAFAAIALVAPETATGLVLQLGAWVGFGSVGYGMLALTAAVVTVAGLPILLAPEQASQSKWRSLGFGPLATYAVTVLGLGLLILWLFHIAAVKGWSQDFYEDRLPVIAAPLLAGLILFQARMARGATFAWRALAGVVMAAILVAATLAAVGSTRITPGGGAYLVLAVAAAGLAADHLRHQLVPKSETRLAIGWAALLVAGIVNIVFWSSPPTRLGAFGVVLQLQFPITWLILAVALATMVLLVRAAITGRSKRPAIVLTYLLGGFVVASVLAILGAWLTRGFKPTTTPAKSRALARTAALHGIHFGIALLLVGYGTSTFMRDEASSMMGDDGLSLSGATYELAYVELDASDGLFVDRINVVVSAAKGDGIPQETPVALRWEPGLGAHVPEPAFVRFWNEEVTLAIDGVAVSSGGTCFAEGIVAANQPSERLCVDDTVDGAVLRGTALPGLGVMWAGFTIFVVAMVALTTLSPKRGATEGKETGNGPQTSYDANLGGR